MHTATPTRSAGLDHCSAPRHVPEALRCPLTGERIDDPVRAADGVAYSRQALVDALAQHDPRVSRLAQSHLGPYPDLNLRSQLDAFDANERELIAGRTEAETDSDAPHLDCPILMDRFVDPVVASDGHTYEASAIERIIRHDGRSPFTRAPLARALIRNRTVAAQLAGRAGAVLREAEPVVEVSEPTRRSMCPLWVRAGVVVSSITGSGGAGYALGTAAFGPLGGMLTGYLTSLGGVVGGICFMDWIDRVGPYFGADDASTNP